MWRSQLHERSKFFLWKLANFGLPVKTNLIVRGIDVEDDRCCHGCQSTENEVHVFFQCGSCKKTLVW